jgi:hypothetical protein
MDRLLADVRRALAGADRPELPPAPPPAAGGDPALLAERFGTELSRAGGRFLVAASEAEARAAAGPGAPPDRADLLIAETGTVVRSYASARESRVSLWDERCVFLATPEALVPDLATALARLAPIHRAGRAYTVFVTGPSRTADIEKVIVIPAHGPRELVVVLVRAPAGC